MGHESLRETIRFSKQVLSNASGKQAYDEEMARSGDKPEAATSAFIQMSAPLWDRHIGTDYSLKGTFKVSAACMYDSVATVILTMGVAGAVGYSDIRLAVAGAALKVAADLGVAIPEVRKQRKLSK